ncbi:MAG: Uma2 family endonuclease [Bryobacterales bacterium]|nr:Uma2 family endonuclease [Bryobacterales bacterium]
MTNQPPRAATGYHTFMGALPVPKMTVKEYLEADQASERPLEYHDGEIFPLAEASLRHAAIETRIGALLHQGLKNKPCEAIGTMRVRVSPTQYVQPDLIVYCGKPVLTDESDPSLTNPSVIFEILSPSTAGYDYSGKFQLYRQLPSFEEYLLVAQDQPRIEVFRRMTDGRWLLTVYEGESAVAKVESLEIEIPLAEIYSQLP